MDQHEKRKLENELLVMGLSNLADPDLIQQLADMVSAWPGDKHDFMRDLLNECDASKRYEMYTAIAPKLGFRALSFPQYEAQIAKKAGDMVSKRFMRVEGSAPKPIEIGGKKYQQIGNASLADGAVATVICYNCGKSERFLADTPAGAMYGARKAGWIRDPGMNKEICGECATKTDHLVEVGSGKSVRVANRFVINDRRRVN